MHQRQEIIVFTGKTPWLHAEELMHSAVPTHGSPRQFAVKRAQARRLQRQLKLVKKRISGRQTLGDNNYISIILQQYNAFPYFLDARSKAGSLTCSAPGQHRFVLLIVLSGGSD